MSVASNTQDMRTTAANCGSEADAIGSDNNRLYEIQTNLQGVHTGLAARNFQAAMKGLRDAFSASKKMLEDLEQGLINAANAIEQEEDANAAEAGSLPSS